MPDVDPAYYDAIDEVIGQRKGEAEWDEDEMRSALMEIAQGESQNAAAEDRDFSQPLLSKRWADVEEVAEEVKTRREEGSGLFRDPLEEAIGEFEGFFEEMNEKYDMGIHNRAVQMMVDEIQDAEQLPAPMYVDQFLRGTNSGVSGADVDYIQRRYETWVQNFQQQQDSGGRMPGSMGGMQSTHVDQGRESPDSMGGGVPVQQQSPGVPPMQNGQQNPSRQQGRGKQGPPPQQGGRKATDPRVAALQEQVEQLTEVVQEAVGDGSNGQKVTVEREDGTSVTMPLEQAVQMGLIGDDGDDDGFIEKLAKAKDAGLIPDESDFQQDDSRSLEETVQLLDNMGVINDDSGEDMADAIGEAIQHLGEKQAQAQQQMSQNFAQVLDQMREMQAEDEEDLTADDVQSIINEELKEDEVDRLERQLKDMRSSFTKELREAKRAGTDGIEDPDYLKTDRKMEFQEKQLETINDNLREIPKEVGMTVREALVPAFKELQHSTPGEGHPLWSPPQQQGEGQPGFVPQTVTEPTQQERRPQQPVSEPERERGYPEPGGEPEPEPRAEQESQGMGQQNPEQGTEERGREVRKKLGLEDSNDNQQAEA